MELQELSEVLSKDVAAIVTTHPYEDFAHDNCIVYARRRYPKLNGGASAITYISNDLIDDLDSDDELYHTIALSLYYELTKAALTKVGVRVYDYNFVIEDDLRFIDKRLV